MRCGVAALVAALLLTGLGACSDDDGDGGDGSEQPSDGASDGDQDGATDDGGEGDGDEPDERDEPEVELLEPVELPAEATPFAEALATTFTAEGAFTSATSDEALCVSTNIVAIVGLERFATAGVTPEAFGANPDLSVLELEPAEAEEIFDVFAGCGLDYADATIDALVLESDDPAAARACLEDVLDDALVRELAVAAILGVIDDSPDLGDALVAAEACTTDVEG